MDGWMGVGPINVGDILMGISRECIFRCIIIIIIKQLRGGYNNNGYSTVVFPSTSTSVKELMLLLLLLLLILFIQRLHFSFVSVFFFFLQARTNVHNNTFTVYCYCFIVVGTLL